MTHFSGGKEVELSSVGLQLFWEFGFMLWCPWIRRFTTPGKLDVVVSRDCNAVRLHPPQQ